MVKFGIIGATGIVGRHINNLLVEKFNIHRVDNIKLFASKQYFAPNIAKNVNFIEKFDINKLEDIDILFSCVNKTFSNKYTDEILDKYPNIKIIDNSSAFRYDENVPLIVPEINGDILNDKNRLIANPNCTTAISVLALNPFDKLFGLKKVIMSTYQAASGAGKAGVDELRKETENYLEFGNSNNKVFQHPLPFNIIPHIDYFHENGYSNEEMKVVKETRKILNNNDIKISCTAVRIPISRSHSMSITVETEKEIDYELLNNYYKEQDDIIRLDLDYFNNQYPMPINTSRKKEIGIGRIRESLIYGKKGCEMFVCGDQLLRGAALNSVLIAEKLLKY